MILGLEIFFLNNETCSAKNFGTPSHKPFSCQPSWSWWLKLMMLLLWQKSLSAKFKVFLFLVQWERRLCFKILSNYLLSYSVNWHTQCSLYPIATLTVEGFNFLKTKVTLLTSFYFELVFSLHLGIFTWSFHQQFWKLPSNWRKALKWIINNSVYRHKRIMSANRFKLLMAKITRDWWRW